LPHYLPFYPATRSELVVPLLRNGQGTPLGSINFESPQLGGFDHEDLEMAQRLASFAVAILTSEDMRERLETSMAMSLMGIADSTWGHEKQTTIRAIKLMAQRCLTELDQGLDPAALRDRLERIERASQSILEAKIPVAPLSGAAREPLVFFKLLHERIQALCKWKYQHVQFHCSEDSDRQAIVEANPEWLKWAIDILVDNAAKQLESQPVRELHLHVHVRHGRVEAALRDTGPGVPLALRPKLGKTRIEKTDGAGGQGLGLLYAGLIVRSYDGELSWNFDEPVGTTAILRLPTKG
jgi:hypothetical protein